MALSVIDLPWLPPAPADLSARIRALAGSDQAVARDFQLLANFPMTPGQASSFSRGLNRCLAAGMDVSPLSSVRLGVLANSTFSLLADAMAPAAARHGVALEVFQAPYDQVAQQALDAASAMNTARLDFVLVAVDHRWFGLDTPDLSGTADGLAQAVDRLSSVVSAMQRHSDATVILQTVATPPSSLFGSYDRRVAGSVQSMIDGLNRHILASADAWSALVLDTAGLAQRVGSDQWFNPVHWHLHKLPFAPACAAIYADHVGRLLGAARGKARKCLVLDLDNTVWGGAVGDDGQDGIVLGEGSAVGEAFVALQKMASALHSRGIVLAVSSKNDEEAAQLVFRQHPEMVLKEDQIAVFCANWRNKASNLEFIAAQLNLGLDALVFLDDNPVERDHVRQALPMVAVPDLPQDPSWYPWILSSAGYFEAVGLSEEDRFRPAAYAADRTRRKVEAEAVDVDGYLAELKMVLVARPFDAAGRKRIAQLINKTNQFNLTTRRYTEAQVAQIEADPDSHGLQVRLADRFGDLGMIAVAICRSGHWQGQAAWDIDIFLMSCRVLGRRVEEAVLAHMAKDAIARGVRWLCGSFIPTPRNGMVEDLYIRLGFDPIGGLEQDQRFVLDLQTYEARELPFTF